MLVAEWGARRTTTSTNCDTNYDFNKGCGTQVLHPGSYGQDFNSVGGGFYALARSKEYGIKVWFWSRASFVPVDVRKNVEAVDPDLWGPPTAYFPTGENCGYEDHFSVHMLIFDLTFCVRSFPHRVSRDGLSCDAQGDWAGSRTVWPESGCSPMPCDDCELRLCRHTGGMLTWCFISRRPEPRGICRCLLGGQLPPGLHPCGRLIPAYGSERSFPSPFPLHCTTSRPRHLVYPTLLSRCRYPPAPAQ